MASQYPYRLMNYNFGLYQGDQMYRSAWNVELEVGFIYWMLGFENPELFFDHYKGYYQIRSDFMALKRADPEKFASFLAARRMGLLEG